MLKKYCVACYWRVKRAAERDCGLPELHGRGKSRACPICKSYAALSSAHGEMPSKRRFIELYRASPRGYEDDNLAFVVRFVGNSMRNGHAAFAQCAEAFELLAAERARSVESAAAA
ncbi:hypothetical protein KFE25_002752 [Diacronema lutheri]|uniref:Uncharacterized protein n=1 Tax=Diacronema lutheri TaxID=2081491 RepID=A0A8J5XU25_DIALT|nr:hypothetical protein KFE25_002752 [Diacronema lutheri]